MEGVDTPSPAEHGLAVEQAKVLEVEERKEEEEGVEKRDMKIISEHDEQFLIDVQKRSESAQFLHIELHIVIISQCWQARPLFFQNERGHL